MPRRHYDPKQKAAAVKRHLIDKVPVSQICEEMGGVQPTVFYNWQNQLFENGDRILGSPGKPQSNAREKQLEARVAMLEQKLARKDTVIAEITEEHVKLKKELGEL